jgi:hypothetical protein
MRNGRGGTPSVPRRAGIDEDRIGAPLRVGSLLVAARERVALHVTLHELPPGTTCCAVLSTHIEQSKRAIGAERYADGPHSDTQKCSCRCSGTARTYGPVVARPR